MRVISNWRNKLETETQEGNFKLKIQVKETETDEKKHDTKVDVYCCIN